MSIRDEFYFENHDLQSYLEEDIAIIKIRSNVFDTLTDLVESGKMLSLIQLAERIPDVKVMMIINQPGCMGDAEYEKFLKRILNRGIDPYAPEDMQGIVQKIDRAREINLLNRTISHLVEFKKISVMALQGNIVTPFFGASLAVDFRFAAEDMNYSLVHLKYGLHPGGALPFFLQRYLSHSKTMDILFNSEKLSAAEGKELGLINRILPAGDFEKRCLKELESICHLDTRVIHATKLLANFSRHDLRQYFDVEAALLH
jgi:enoyl-CoA hydratase/carnithine racemase